MDGSETFVHDVNKMPEGKVPFYIVIHDKSIVDKKILNLKAKIKYMNGKGSYTRLTGEFNGNKYKLSVIRAIYLYQYPDHYNVAASMYGSKTLLDGTNISGAMRFTNGKIEMLINGTWYTNLYTGSNHAFDVYYKVEYEWPSEEGDDEVEATEYKTTYKCVPASQSLSDPGDSKDGHNKGDTWEGWRKKDMSKEINDRGNDYYGSARRWFRCIPKLDL